MTDHVHRFRVFHAALEEGDPRAVRCACGALPGRHAATFPYIPPGSNALRGMHWAAVAQWRAQTRRDAALLVPAIVLTDRVRLTLDFRWRTRIRRDPGNYIEGTKGLVDGLVGRWLVDDAAAHLVLAATGQVGTGLPDHILLTLEELASGG